MATSLIGPLLVARAFAGRAGAAAAAADQGDLDRVVLGGVDLRDATPARAEAAATAGRFRKSRREGVGIEGVGFGSVIGVGSWVGWDRSLGGKTVRPTSCPFSSRAWSAQS